MPFSLYVHVPFCTRTCPYCDFYQVPPGETREARFVSALLAEAGLASWDTVLSPAVVETLYWGGGTPSLLSAEAVRTLAGGLAAAFDLSDLREFTVEANPGEAPPHTLSSLRSAGATRLSLGCQSFQPERLGFLGRLHTPADSRAGLANARQAGFDNVSLDLIFNLPAELPSAGWRADVREVIALAPEHVSVYGLTLEPRTAFGHRAARGELTLPQPETYADEYLWAASQLEGAGYLHYETSSFARPGRESIHNRRYWSGESYLGLGPGAHSLWDGTRWANVASLERWAVSVLAGHPERDVDVSSDPSSGYAETLYLGLRSVGGLEASRLRGDPVALERFTHDLRGAALARAGSDLIVLTDEGHLVLDEIVARLMDLETRVLVRPAV
ncbi:MAG: radical SAM family heme chaperone HemW [Gemmatimonadetes bacterium]|nr:radical SAM family heme chaperone HemW [Gemmatimonadota bacterium]